MTATHAPLTVEVVARAGATIVDVRQVDRRCPVYRIGEGPRAHAPVAVGGAGADGCVALIELRGGSPWLALPSGASGELRRGAAAEPLVAGQAVQLTEGTCAIVQVGPLRFELRASPDEPAPAFRPTFDGALWLGQAASLALCMALMVMVRMFAAEAEAPRWDDPELQERLIRYTASLPPADPPARPFVADLRPSPRPEPPAPAVKEEPRAPEEPPALPGVAAGPRGQDRQDMAREAGFLGLAEFDRIVGNYTKSLQSSIKHYARSAADEAAWAAAAEALPRAVAGLELSETLRGGGGEARGVVDLPVTLLARVDRDGKRRWAGHGRKEAAFARTIAAEVREAPRQSVEWTASIGHDLIRGIVRRHTPEVRRCFREADPSLTGKLEVAFTIVEGGRVEAVAIEESSLADRAVERCVAAAVQSWTFPTIVAAAGAVAVRYPFSVG